METNEIPMVQKALAHCDELKSWLINFDANNGEGQKIVDELSNSIKAMTDSAHKR